MAKSLDLAARYYLRYLIQIPSVYRPSGKPHILILSTRRSGSTLLRDMLASQRGFNYIDQPFDFTKNQFNPYRRRFPASYAQGQIVTAPADERARMREYLNGLLSHRYVVRSQWRFWDKSYHWVWERYVVKELSTKAMASWYEETWGDEMKIVFLVRHPLGTIRSIAEKTWDHTFGAFLENEEFAEVHLTQKMRALGRKIAADGSPVEQHILDWCLENLIPLRLWKDHRWTAVSYERIIESPESTARRLCQRLDLPEPEKLIEAIAIPTRSATPESRRMIEQSGPVARLSAWMKTYDTTVLAQATRILEAFEINAYSVERPYAAEELDAR